MEPISVIKVAAAFVGGIVVALGSALIYVKVGDMVHPVPAVQAGPQAQELPSAGNSTSAPVRHKKPAEDSSASSSAAEGSHPRDVSKPKVVHRQVSGQPIEPVHHQPNRTTVEIAQNTYPSISTAPTSVPAQAPNASAPASSSSGPANSGPQPFYAQPQPPQYTQAAPTPPQPHIVTLDPGTALNIRLGEMLSTDHNYTGDTFRGSLESPIIKDGFIIADHGSKVLGRVVTAEKAGRIEGLATLTITLTEINTTDGQRVRIAANSVEQKGPSSTGQDAAKIAGGAALGAIIGAIAGGGKGAAIGAGAGGAAGTGLVLSTRGRPAVMQTETRLSFRLAEPVTITEKLNY